MATACISVRGLSKAFLKVKATRSVGISSSGVTALRHLVRQIVAPPRTAVQARRGQAFLALDDVSFDVAPGEVLGIIGRNGAGKTTLLKILARVLHPTAGRATIRGRVVSMLELGIGFAPELTVHQNIQISGRLAGMPARRIADAEDSILEFAGLTELRDVPLAACPSGSGVRLGFAAMVGLGAEVVLADEVLAVGDTAFRRACEARVRAAGASGESVLFVSHDMGAIRRICTRVIWIDRGRIVRDGPTEEVVSAYTAELLAGHLRPPLTGEGLAASCVLLDLRLLDAEQAQVGALQLTEAGYIDCLFRVARPDVVVTVDIELWTAKHHVFTATSQPITAAAMSTLRAGIRIPAHLLNEREYEARLRLRAAAASGDTPPVVVADERLTFSAMNPHPEQSVWSGWSGGRAGLISPRLAWSLDRV